MSSAVPELEAAIDRLYQVPVAGFTEARNALAAERKAAGDKEGASRVKALPKPSAVAWAVNQVYWKHRPLFDALVAAIAGVAAAQREALRGDGAAELREATGRKGGTLQQVLRVAERRLLESGAQAGPPVLQRVAATLEAAASPRPPGAAGPQAGRLAAELQPAGFEVALGFDALDLPPVPPRSTHEPARDATGSGGAGAPRADHDARARQAVQQAELELARLRREAATATRALAEAESRAAAARADVAQLEARLQQVRARAEQKSEAERAARRALEDARAAAAAAEAALAALERSEP